MNRYIKQTALFLIAAAVLLQYSGCRQSGLEFETESLSVKINPGEEWLHDFPVLGPITKPNAPTFAVWITDEDNNFIETVFATRKIGNASWIVPDDSRPEALPLWAYSRGGQPDSEHPVPDALSGASPVGGSEFFITGGEEPEPFIIWLEINHSVDYNGSWPDGVTDSGSSDYSGGKGGSGQPALVYNRLVDLNADKGISADMSLRGHSEPGGIGAGNIYNDISSLTTALAIVDSIEVMVK